MVDFRMVIVIQCDVSRGSLHPNTMKHLRQYRRFWFRKTGESTHKKSDIALAESRKAVLAVAANFHKNP